VPHCEPTTISRLQSLKSLTDLQLTIVNRCDPKPLLISLQPFASVLTHLDLISLGRTDNTADAYPISYLLPFRSLTKLLISISNSRKYFHVSLTGPFISKQWSKLAQGSIDLTVNLLDLVPFLRELISLASSSTPSLLTSLTSSSSENDRKQHENDSLLFGIRFAMDQLTLNNLNEFLLQMEDASLLIPSSSSSTITTSSPTSISVDLPKISIECMLGYRKEEVEVLKDRCDMIDRVKSRHYINMSSFTVRTIRNDEDTYTPTLDIYFIDRVPHLTKSLPHSVPIK
jgi:hypothetical protein